MSYPLLLQRRDHYLCRIKEDLRIYNPDTRALINGYLPKNPVIRTPLHDLVATLYDRMHQANVQELPERDAIYGLYNSVKKQIINYAEVKSVKTHEPSELAATDQWTSQISYAKDQTTAQSFLDASDRVEDLLFLAELALKNELPEEVSHLGAEIESVLTVLPKYTNLISIDGELNEKMKQCFENLKFCYQEKKYSEAIRKVEEAKVMIKI